MAQQKHISFLPVHLVPVAHPFWLLPSVTFQMAFLEPHIWTAIQPAHLPALASSMHLNLHSSNQVDYPGLRRSRNRQTQALHAHTYASANLTWAISDIHPGLVQVLRTTWLRQMANKMAYYNKPKFATNEAMLAGRLHTWLPGGSIPWRPMSVSRVCSPSRAQQIRFDQSGPVWRPADLRSGFQQPLGALPLQALD